MSIWYPCVYCTEDLHCTKYEEPGYESWCVLGPCTEETPSHGDQIRRMSDEELAALIEGRICPETSCPDIDRDGPPDKKHCTKCWLDWMRQKA